LYVKRDAYNTMDVHTAAVKASIITSDNANTDVTNVYVGGAIYGTVSFLG
jgi:hypothetical protein